MTTRPEPDEPAVMRELHDLRERLHEQWKDWSDERLLEHLHSEGAKTAKRLGLRITPRPEQPSRKVG